MNAAIQTEDAYYSQSYQALFFLLITHLFINNKKKRKKYVYIIDTNNWITEIKYLS